MSDKPSILNLQLATDPRWTNLAAVDLQELLTDHAYCEMKAASSCISIIQRYNQKVLIVSELMPIVSEEWGHFRLVVHELTKRGWQLGAQRKDDYVNQLLKFCQTGGNEEGRLLDQLLAMAMIEARSCERFKTLSEGLQDPYLQKFYRRFMESEAGHYTIFITLAEHYIPKSVVQARWQAWLKHESEVISGLPQRIGRVH